jgi:hypothetical protein
MPTFMSLLFAHAGVLAQLCGVFVVSFALALSWFAWIDPLDDNEEDNRQIIKTRACVRPLTGAAEDCEYWESLDELEEQDGCAPVRVSHEDARDEASRRRRYASCRAQETLTPPLGRGRTYTVDSMSMGPTVVSRHRSFEMLSLSRRHSESEPYCTRLPSVCEVSMYSLKRNTGKA